MTDQSRPVLLGQNQYGKAENRVVRIVRDGRIHHIKDLSVSVALSGDMEEVHTSGSNATVLPTDTTKNTVFAFAKEHGIESAERFGIALARHFVTSQEPIERARIRIEEYAWERIEPNRGARSDGGAESNGAESNGTESNGADSTGADSEGADEAKHSFVRKGQETRIAQITFDGEDWEVLAGLKDLTVLNSTDSEFWGYVKDKYTTLQEAYDRILATEVSALWRYNWTGGEDGQPDWERSYGEARKHLLEAFAETYSLSLQQTLYQMGSRVIDHRAEIDEVRLSLPNKHHFLVDLTPFGLKNDNEVYYAADRPYGLIEGTVLRAGAQQRIPVDMTNL
ncbi:factor-independent urate hydroxylase [Wenjunlia tyrosinilytica]|uniref:Uricase n=1 Tax=Wenjunlia tyrosinilytica TaxID=1544741 RepID=A0A918E086_9ACTN|nr:urate oxidase [Wenjunlia tyrosinilytica]GGO92481.1 uricase [Wenjunlia tyrosinilytica]